MCREIIEKFIKDKKAIILMISYIIACLGYEIINNIETKSYNLTIALDYRIPLIKYFVIPYYAWYLLIFFSFIYIYIKDNEEFYSFVKCMILTMVTALMIFVFFQTSVVRPIIIDSDFFSNLIKDIYARDNPINCCPSLHVSITLVCSIWINKVSENKYLKGTVFILGILIILSTLFIKQHVIMDVVVAFIQAFLIKNIVDISNELSLERLLVKKE